jgi:hypothetical protein
MPDLICPPVWTTPKPCTCRGVRLGVGLLSMCGYSAFYSPVFFGASLAAVVADAMRGDVPVIWTACAVFGALSLIGGIYQIRRDGHGFKAGSFIWSCGVGGAVAWRLAHYPDCIGQTGWFGYVIDAFNYHLVRMLLIAWLASNASNVALNLFEAWRLHRRARPVRRPVAQPEPGDVLHGRQVTEEWVAEFDAHGIEGALEAVRNALHAPPHASTDLIEGGEGVPQIDYVRDENGDFVPVMPPGERVPVRRR